MRICFFLLFALTFLAAAHPARAAFDLDREVAAMKATGKPQKIGNSSETGYYIICVEEVGISAGLNDNQAAELALVQAKKTIAGFFETKVDASLTQTRETGITVKGTEETAILREMTREFTQIDIRQLLRGVVVHKMERKGDFLEITCFFSQKMADAAKEMRDSMNEFPPDTVRSVGIAMTGRDNIDAVRDRALLAAKREAIGQVLGTTLSGVTQVQDAEQVRAKIFASSSGFIETYRIVEEGGFPGGYRVVIVAKVAKDKLLSDYSSLSKAMGDPGFYIRADNQDLYLTFVKFFSELGLRLVATPDSADYMIEAHGEYRTMKHPASGREGVQLSLWIRIFDTTGKQELLSQKNDPRQSAVFQSSGGRQKEIATEKAFAQIREPLHKELNRLIGKMTTSDRLIQIVIDNYSGAFSQELAAITEAVEMIPGSSAANVRIDGVGMRAVLSANYLGSMDALESFLRAAMEKRIPARTRIPRTVSISANRLELSF